MNDLKNVADGSWIMNVRKEQMNTYPTSLRNRSEYKTSQDIMTQILCNASILSKVSNSGMP